MDRLIVDVGGVGFETLVSRGTALQAGQIGDTVVIHTSLAVRENEWQLFGFASPDEKELFALLQSVSGVGPKMALSLVGTLGPRHLAESVCAADQKSLSQAPGVGAKLAQRIILELKSKMEDWQMKKGAAVFTSTRASAAREEAKQILSDLGYTLTEISQVFKRLEPESPEEDVEMLVSQSLRALGTADR